jgi:hypothetical protein
MAHLYRIVAMLQLQLWTTSWPVSRQTAPYSSELEPEIVLIEPQPWHAFGVDDILQTRWQHNVALSGSIPLHWVAELIAFSIRGLH